MTRIEMMKLTGVNCYLVRGDGGAALVDTGNRVDRKRLLSACNDAGVTLIVLTHSHIDHAANAAFLSKELKVPVALHEADFEPVKNRRVDRMYAHTRTGRLVLPVMSLGNGIVEAFENPVFLREGDLLEPYGVEARVMELPGHTRGSIGILAGDGLIVGDALMNFFSPKRALFYQNRDGMEKSAARIGSSGARTIYFGHGSPCENRRW